VPGNKIQCPGTKCPNGCSCRWVIVDLVGYCYCGND
jgi:hypothetical protein